ncbi:fructose-bisphosphate aldolase [Actinorhabdospora filicis]|uniref:Fructose-bisphosphate aldolase n=1 Tax=Actinorhabdospora filicis TaxID=1785913 RepID=A0A9W6SK29_9ACTN|nr:class II fructose-bisphosphate aldolase [Actinorhabdospora filicis]GLZ77079.1 fructose-bisphosphate aldolase [Actinorhabdospora filicis]
MPLVHTAALVTEARREGFGLGAFNVITLEHAEAIVAGAEAAGRPVILQISENAVKFHHGRLDVIARASQAVAAGASVPVALHLDHVESEALWRQAAGLGFGSVMVDYSKLPYDENLRLTTGAVEDLQAEGLYVESELGKVGGKEGEAPLSAHAPGARTDPGEAAAYVAATGVDALAVAVGSSHAMTSRDAALDHELIARIAAAVPVPLVLHGSSGVPDEELARAVKGGMVKINIGTALNIAFTGAVRAHLEADPKVVDPRKYIKDARAAMAATVEHFLGVLG